MARSDGIRAVAAEAGVSITTVSHALSGHGQVSEETRRRVLEVASRLGYAPNPVARALRSSSRQVLGFVSEEIATTPYAGKILVGAQAAAAEHGYMLMIVNVPRDVVVDTQVDALIAHQVDAVIVASTSNRVIRTPAALDPARTVLVDAFDPELPVASIVPDEVGIGMTATRRLLDAGHRRILHITVDEDAPAAHGRERGYRQAMDELGLPSQVIRLGDSGTAQTGAAAIARLLADPTSGRNPERPAGAAPSLQTGTAHRADTAGTADTADMADRADPSTDATRAGGRAPDLPTAVFAFNDQMAMGVYQELRDHGLRVPDDMSVIGVDDLELVAAAIRPGLTTVALPHEAMGRRAVEAALALPLADGPRSAVVRLPGMLVERASIASPVRVPIVTLS